MQSLRSCLRGLRGMSGPSRSWALACSLLGLVRIAASLSFVWVCKELVDVATGASTAPLAGRIAMMACIMAVQLASNVAYSYCEKYGILQTQNALRHRLFGEVLASEWSGRERFGSGDAVNRLEEDIRVVSELLCSHIPGAAVTLCQLVAASAYLLLMAPGLLWVLLILMLVGIGGSRLFFLKLRSLTSDIRSLDSDIQQLIQENLQNRILALTLIGTARVLGTLGSLQSRLKTKTTERLNYNAVARGLMSLGFMGGYAAAFIWGILGIRSGAVSFGMMTAFLQLVGQVQRPVADLSRELPAFIHALTSIERLMELDSLPAEEDGPRWIADGAAGVRFNGVSFKYPDASGQEVLKAFSHDFRPGTLTAIAGPTGAGKSTLVKLILGLLKPESGVISIYDGKSSCPAGKSARGNFRYVPQGNSLMSGTIRSNLLLADRSATEESMREALHIAAADFVFDLPLGLDSICGESGSGLSEGQCQRIAVARALLQQGSILLLDEATSSLDPATERLMLDNLREYMKRQGLTIIFISHREAVTAGADMTISL